MRFDQSNGVAYERPALVDTRRLQDALVHIHRQTGRTDNLWDVLTHLYTVDLDLAAQAVRAFRPTLANAA